MLPKNITVVGLGLMGGSLVRALRPYVPNIIAVDANLQTMATALQTGIVDQVASSLTGVAGDSDLLILATPARTILQQLNELSAFSHNTTILDLGSTKEKICGKMGELPASYTAVGGHPLCGKEKSGFVAADKILFQNQSFVLCETARSTPTAKKMAEAVVQAVGAKPLWLPASTHDEIVAATSHLPYLVSAAVMANAGISAQQHPHTWQVSANGLHDMTRLSASDPSMMLDILLTNREAILDQIAGMKQNLTTMEAMLKSGDEKSLLEWLKMNQQTHKLYRQEKRG